MAQREIQQIFPQRGWVEHDPLEIWSTQLDTAREAIAKAGLKSADIRAIGITNQRETTVLWNRRTGKPVYNAIVWQDRRTEPYCAQLRSQGLETVVQQTTGLRIDPYFSATKLRWVLDHVESAREALASGELAFGTVDSWLLWQLTGGAVHATDVSNASRTMLFDIHQTAWDQKLLNSLNIPEHVLPRVLPSSGNFGETRSELFGTAIPVTGIAGDQQAALFGQACFRAGQAKNTYGTGCFMLMHTGAHAQPSVNGLITTAAAQSASTPQFALEGSVFIGGAVVQWLRDGLRAIESSHEVQSLAESVPDTGGVVMVPAFTGLGAPYWQPEVRGSIVGLSRSTTMAHIARAALESIAFQSAVLLQAMDRDACADGGVPVSELRVDGGACVNDFLMQFQADLLGIPVLRPKVVETTALGAAYLAGLSCGLWNDQEELSEHWKVQRVFEPLLSRERAAELMSGWERAVRQTSVC
jgi:glycerol kinase